MFKVVFYLAWVESRIMICGNRFNPFISNRYLQRRDLVGYKGGKTPSGGYKGGGRQGEQNIKVGNKRNFLIETKILSWDQTFKIKNKHFKLWTKLQKSPANFKNWSKSISKMEKSGKRTFKLRSITSTSGKCEPHLKIGRKNYNLEEKK